LTYTGKNNITNVPFKQQAARLPVIFKDTRDAANGSALTYGAGFKNLF